MSTPNLGMPNVPTGTLEPSIPLNDALQLLDALVPGVVQAITATPPTTVSGDAGKVWIVDGSATGAWAGHDDELAISTGADLWRYVTPQDGWRFHNLDDGDDYRLDSGAWTAVSGGGGSGDVVGPASSIDDRIATFDGATGKLLQDGGKTIAEVRLIEPNSQSTAYTAVLSDGGKHLLHPSADTTARTFTIPANSSVAYPIGTAITFVNQDSAGVLTIAITTDTMRLAGAGTTGSRTLAANGIATALKITSIEWIISGTGLT